MMEYDFNQQLSGNSPSMIYASIGFESNQQKPISSTFDTKPSFFQWFLSRNILEKSSFLSPSKSKKTE